MYSCHSVVSGNHKVLHQTKKIMKTLFFFKPAPVPKKLVPKKLLVPNQEATRGQSVLSPPSTIYPF